MRMFPFSILIIILLVSCEFEPDGNNYIEVSPPNEMIQVEIALNDVLPENTIYLFGYNATFNIHLNSGDEEVIKINITIDDKQIMELSGNPGKFTLSNYDFGKGEIHKLSVSAILKSGTGSLADLMGFEGYSGELSWNIKIIDNPENFGSITNCMGNDRDKCRIMEYDNKSQSECSRTSARNIKGFALRRMYLPYIAYNACF